MPRIARQCPGGYVYHVWNRGAGRLRLFKKPEDYLAFEQVLVQAHDRHPIALLDWCLMPNHWHFIVYPSEDEQVTAFFRWLTHTHAMRAITHRRVMGMGPLYQGRFKSLPVQGDEHLLTLLRYIQRNPVRAKLSRHAAEWRWGGEGVRHAGLEELRRLLAPWPVDRPRTWTRWVDEATEPSEQKQIRECIRRSRPLGDATWTYKTARQLSLLWTLRPRGGQKKMEK
jgi:putative transposase